jgi:hypothetical protein
MAATSRHSKGWRHRDVRVLVCVHRCIGVGQRKSTISKHSPGVWHCHNDSWSIFLVTPKAYPVGMRRITKHLAHSVAELDPNWPDQFRFVLRQINAPG